MALAGGRGFTERFLLFNSSPHLLRSFRKSQAAGSHAGRHEGGREGGRPTNGRRSPFPSLPPSMHPGWRADVFSHNCRVAPPSRRPSMQ